VKFKLDENFGTRTQRLFQTAGHDVSTVEQERLSGCPDRKLYDVCVRERRYLVTLDMDFSDVTRFDPSAASGIVVVRLPHNPTLAVIEELVRNFLRALADEALEGRLWIVEPGRIRIHQNEDKSEET